MDFLESAGGCPKHAPTEEEDMGWAEKDNGTFLPMVNIGLQMFAPNMRQVVKVRGMYQAVPLVSWLVSFTCSLWLLWYT